MPFQAYLFSRAAVKSTQTISFLSVSNGKFLLIMLKILSLRRGKRKRDDAFYVVKSAMLVAKCGGVYTGTPNLAAGIPPRAGAENLQANA